MKYVLDSSVALEVVLPEADSARAVRLLDEYANAIHALIAPDLFTPEVANGLVSAERQGRLKKGESVLLLHDLQLNAPVFFPSSPLLVRAMEIALATRQAVYDCIYLALAESMGCELVTADDKLIKNLRPTFPFIVALVALP
jgi:predicted nucleic acid-binding protein